MIWLFIEPGRIGDWILSQHVVSRFAREHGIRIAWAVRRQVLPLLPLGPEYDEVITLPSPATAPRIAGLALHLLAHRMAYDGCVALSPARTGRFAVRWLRSHHRLGYCGPEFQCTAYTGQVMNYQPNVHHLMSRALMPFYPDEAGHGYAFLQKNSRYHPHLAIPQTWQHEAAGILKNSGLREKAFVLITPGAKWPGRLWDDAQWLRLAGILSAEHDAVVFSRDPQCGSLNLLLEKTRLPKNVHLLPELPLTAFISILSAAKGIVTLDSAPMHMAAALGIPAVALYGPSNVQLTGALTSPDRIACVHGKLPCQPCITPAIEPPRSACLRPGMYELRDCMASIALQEVVEQVRNFSRPQISPMDTD